MICKIEKSSDEAPFLRFFFLLWFYAIAFKGLVAITTQSSPVLP